MPKLLFSPENHPELTYADVFLVPYNPARDPSKAGTSDPVDRSKPISRDEVDIRPVDGFGNIPITVSNMNAVTGKRMAEAMAVLGGSAAVPQDKDDDEMKEIADFLHSRDVRYVTPTMVTSDTRVHDLTKWLEKRDLGTAIVTDDQGKLVGIVRLQKKDDENVKEGNGIIPNGTNQDAHIRRFIRQDCVTAQEGITDEDALSLMEKHRLDFLPIVDVVGHVKGVLTIKSIAARFRYKSFINESNGGLAMLATVGALNNDPVDRVKFFIDLGVRGIIFDTAHFDQGVDTYRNVEAAATIIANARRKVLLVAGNVVTAEATRNIVAAGADIAKVGIGPGAMCTTRMETAVGRPQFTAVLECAAEARKHGKNIWADGGIQHPRDVALALAAGASQVMIGSLFTPTLESPGDLKSDGEKGEYKINHGMASRHAATLRNIGKEERNRMRDLFRTTFGHRSEGLSGAKVYRRHGMRSVVDYVHWLLDGLTSSMTYAGARNLEEFREFATVGLQTMSGYEEGKAKSEL